MKTFVLYYPMIQFLSSVRENTANEKNVTMAVKPDGLNPTGLAVIRTVQLPHISATAF